MFSPKMQDYVFGLLSFICSLKGLSCTLWTMKVEDQVNGTLGQNVILPCFFTHPKQNAYTGDITVKWMQDKKIEPIFQCKFHNKTNGQDSNCIEQSLSERHLLQAPAQILSLYLDLDVVKCIARGNPLPQIKWTSSSGPLKNIPFKTDPRKYIVNSSVPFSDQAVYTCQVVNSLGQDQKAFPPNHPNCLSLSVVTGILACLLLLGLIAVILDVVKRRKNAQRVMLQDMGVQRVQTSVYQDNKTVYANINICPVGRETRQVGVYSTGSLREGRKKEMIPGAPKIRPPRPPGPPPDIDKK
ncbi:sialic acid binding Ig-like lectin 15, like isoform X2 [Onychostoma macrolepis]|uniref:sialic acid binding Ig-like lectin 15, like isoform X2 n=1 Tax=Onychostoma macrolepis TaxID=369639 RepID=UPI00272BB42E|nr:sialic acid binding Ig-like lectin 15, like isoform X2 [Onychostoma macrolepis]